ncbi:MAG: hypothetical protein LBD99_03690 [Candidatus Margulisbacteria bacterium]|jgi:hypothetical protein|nr:hypothetical protein [Candidatus Margulisiibacteriota bacterium]
MESGFIAKYPVFRDVEEAAVYARAHSIDPRIAPEEYELAEYFYIFRTAREQLDKIDFDQRRGASPLAIKLTDDVNLMYDFLPDWFDRDNAVDMVNKLPSLPPDQVLIGQILLVMFRDLYDLAVEVNRGVNQERYDLCVQRSRQFNEALLEHCRRTVRAAAAETGVTISAAELDEQALFLSGKLPECMLLLEQIYTILPETTPEALAALRPTARDIEKTFFLLAEERTTGDNGLFNILRKFFTLRPDLLLPGWSKLSGRYDPHILTSALARSLLRFENLLDNYYAENIIRRADNSAALDPDGSTASAQVEANIQTVRRLAGYMLRVRDEQINYDYLTLSLPLRASPENKGDPGKENPYYNPLYRYADSGDALASRSYYTAYTDKIFAQLNQLAALELAAAKQAPDKKQAYIHYKNAEAYLAEYAECADSADSLLSRIVPPRDGPIVEQNAAQAAQTSAALSQIEAELDNMQADISGAPAAEAAALLAAKKEYLPLYYALRAPEEKVWENIAANARSLDDALVLLECPAAPAVLPDSLFQKTLEYIKDDSVKLAMQGADSPVYPAILRIQEFYAEHPERLPSTGDAPRLLSLLKQLFQPEEAAAERAQTAAPQTVRPASPSVAIDISAEARATETVHRVTSSDISDNQNFIGGLYSWDDIVFDFVPISDISGLSIHDLSIGDDVGTAFFPWLESYSRQFRNSSNTLLGFIYDGKYYSVDSSGVISAVDADKYSYNSDTGVMTFYDPALYSGLDTVDGSAFYNLTVAPNTGAGTVVITDYAPNSRAYTADGSIDIDLGAGSSYTLNISLEQFIAICLAGGLHIGIPGDTTNPYAIISPGDLVSLAAPSAQKFELTVNDRNASRMANHYAGLVSAREISHTDIAAATPHIEYQGADVSHLFAPQIQCLGAARHRNGLLIGAGEVTIKTSHWELDAGGNPAQIEQEIKLLFPEEAEYITGDEVDIPAGLELSHKILPADLDRADRAALAAQGIDLLAYLGTAFADPRNNAALGFYLDIEGQREYIPLPRFALACADYRAAHPEIETIGWEDLAGILSIYKGRELRDVSPHDVAQVTRPAGLTITPEAGAGWDSRAGFFTPFGLRVGWDTPRFSLNAYLGDELGVETLCHKITGGLSALGAPFISLPGLQIFGGAEAETRLISADYPLASGAKARLGLLYDWRITDNLRWRNALGGKFLAVLLDGDIQATAWKAEYESVLQIQRWSPYLKTGILFAENKMFLAKDALYRDFPRDMDFDQLEIGTSFAMLVYKDIFALDINFNTDIAAGSLGAGFSVVLQKPRGLRWDISALGAVSPMQEWYAGGRENILDTAQLNLSSSLRWPSGFFLKAGYELERAGETFHRATLSGGYTFRIHQ